MSTLYKDMEPCKYCKYYIKSYKWKPHYCLKCDEPILPIYGNAGIPFVYEYYIYLPHDCYVHDYFEEKGSWFGEVVSA